MKKRRPPAKTRITILLEDVVLDHFRARAARPGAEPYQTQVNRVLREYVSAQRLAARPTQGVAEPRARYGRARRAAGPPRGVRGPELRRTITAVVRPGEQSGYTAECLEIPVVTQGKTLDEVAARLRKAVALHLEGEDLRALGLAEDPTLLVSLELLPAHA